MGSKVDLDRHRGGAFGAGGGGAFGGSSFGGGAATSPSGGLASRPRRRRLGKPKPRHRSPAVVRLLSARQPGWWLWIGPGTSAFGASGSGGAFRSTNISPKRIWEHCEGRSRGGLEEAGVHLVVEANKAADYLELVVPLHRKLAIWNFNAIGLVVWESNRNKINPRPLVNLRKSSGFGATQQQQSGSFFGSKPAAAPGSLFGVHLNKRVVGAACSDTGASVGRYWRFGSAAPIAAASDAGFWWIRRVARATTAATKYFFGQTQSTGGSSLFGTQQTQGSSSESLIKEANNLGSALRHKRRQFRCSPAATRSSRLAFGAKPAQAPGSSFGAGINAVDFSLWRRSADVASWRSKRLWRCARKWWTFGAAKPAASSLVAVHNNRAPADYLVQLGLCERRIILRSNAYARGGGGLFGGGGTQAGGSSLFAPKPC